MYSNKQKASKYIREDIQYRRERSELFNLSKSISQLFLKRGTDQGELYIEIILEHTRIIRNMKIQYCGYYILYI